MSGRPSYHSNSSSSSLSREHSGEANGYGGGENSSCRPRGVERRVTQLPGFAPTAGGKVYGGGNAVHDGVFANLSAKPERGGEDPDEKPPVSTTKPRRIAFAQAYSSPMPNPRSFKDILTDLTTDI